MKQAQLKDSQRRTSRVSCFSKINERRTSDEYNSVKTFLERFVTDMTRVCDARAAWWSFLS
jgi:hypothetical protein